MAFSDFRTQRIRGTVDGTVTGRRIHVSKSGHVLGSIGADTVVIAGEVVGTVRAHVIHLLDTAHVAGELLYDSLTVDPGACVEARCHKVGA